MNNETFTLAEERQRRINSRKIVTYLLLFSIVMFFAGLTSAYVVSKASIEYWVVMKLPSAFIYSTVLILIGSLPMHLALNYSRKGRQQYVAPLITLTLLFASGFTYFQFQGWSHYKSLGNYMSFSNVLQPSGVYGQDFVIEADGLPLVKQGDEFFHPEDKQMTKPLNSDMSEQVNGSSQYFYVLTWAHITHVGFGLVSLMVMIFMAFLGRYSQDDNVGLWAGTLYWHFLGGLWVYLLLFLLFVH
jgi:cytochrome c oxidase subunit 3